MSHTSRLDHRIAGYQSHSAPISNIQGWVILILIVLILSVFVPSITLHSEILALGVIGIWRWSWAGLQLLRAFHYRRTVFPKLRAIANRAPLPPSVYVIVTSYRMESGLNAAVYGALLADLAKMGRACCVVAAVTDPADARVLDTAFNRQAMPEGSSLHLVFQDGTGKRAAMVDALRVVRDQSPSTNDQLILMDGDTLINPGDLEKTCRYLQAFPNIGAVTTDNRALVKGSSLTREWYRLRLAQRDVQMSSMALSKKLLVLTGRFSVFRMQVALLPSFALAISRDSLNHWRLGRIAMVTGDDKSTWFVTLSNGWDMGYLPDVCVNCLEELPQGNWRKATTGLMRRWYGNMVRNNGRAIALGKKRLGLFPWWCLIDQRITPWTTILAPSLLVGIMVTENFLFLMSYLLWVIITRLFVSIIESKISGRKFHPAFPFLLYYSQIMSAVIKIKTFHFPDRQGWNRQGVGSTKATQAQEKLSHGYLALSLAAFSFLVYFLSPLSTPDSRFESPNGISALFER